MLKVKNSSSFNLKQKYVELGPFIGFSLENKNLQNGPKLNFFPFSNDEKLV
jgi:hypothetical protein